MGAPAAGQAFCAFFFADLDVVQDRVHLILRDLRPHLRRRQQRVAHLDPGDARDGQVQTSPLLNANKAKPSSALSRKSSSSSITSAKKMFGDLPPSSSVCGMIGSEGSCMIRGPVGVSPPGALMTLSTPGGSSSPASCAKIMMLSGVLDAGLMTTQLPAPIAGASFHAAISSGKFQGMIWPTTPRGSLK